MSYTLLSETWPVARKQHRCIWCGQHIAPGEKYRRERSVYDGEMQDHKWHPECDADAAEQFRQGEDEFSPYENERPTYGVALPASRSTLCEHQCSEEQVGGTRCKIVCGVVELPPMDAARGVPVVVAANPALDQGPCTVCGKPWREHGTYPVYESHNYTPAGGVAPSDGGQQG